MAFEFELPVNGVEIIFFVGKMDAKIVGENISYLVEGFETAVVSNDGFCAS
jgi:hypothetical protein